MLKRVVKISGLIFDESPLVISTTLAKLVGLNSSIIIQQMHYWLVKSDKVFILPKLKNSLNHDVNLII